MPLFCQYFSENGNPKRIGLHRRSILFTKTHAKAPLDSSFANEIDHALKALSRKCITQPQFVDSLRKGPPFIKTQQLLDSFQVRSDHSFDVFMSTVYGRICALANVKLRICNDCIKKFFHHIHKPETITPKSAMMPPTIHMRIVTLLSPHPSASKW